jgi:AcrR family transcriptional regulator
MKADGHTAKDIAKYLGVSRATLYRYLAQGDAPLEGIRVARTKATMNGVACTPLRRSAAVS